MAKELENGRAYAWTMDVALGKAEPEALPSGMVRFALDEAGNGVSVEMREGAVAVRVFGPDTKRFSILPEYANAFTVVMVDA